jgi:hypothetical protein
VARSRTRTDGTLDRAPAAASKETPMTATDPEALVATRTTIHGIAEHILVPAAWRTAGTIRLLVRDGALSTPELPGVPGLTGLPGRSDLGAPVRLSLRDPGVVVREPEGLVVPLHGPLGTVADALGVRFGIVDPPYSPSSGCGPDHLADVRPDALATILAAWRTGDAALRRLATQQPVVWPEHLDVAITVGAVNYGVSPGDQYLPRPYAYVGPHTPRSGPFWNAPFGAARPLTDLDGEDAVLAFLAEGMALAEPQT